MDRDGGTYRLADARPLARRGSGALGIGGTVGEHATAPPFSSVARALLDLVQSGQILGNLSISLGNLAIGVVVAAIVGMPAGVAMGRSRLVALVAEPYLNALLAAPSLVFVPVLYTLSAPRGRLRLAASSCTRSLSSPPRRWPPCARRTPGCSRWPPRLGPPNASCSGRCVGRRRDR